MPDLERLVGELSALTVLEAAELTKMLERKWGVSAMMPVAAMPTPTPPAAPVAEEKTEFAVILKDIGPKKIEVIKVIRQITGLGLKDAKDMAERPEARIVEGLGRQAATGWKDRFEAAGARAEVV